MKDRRLSYQDSEDGIAILVLFDNEETIDSFHVSIEELPEEASLGDQYQPEVEDGELVAMQYDEELTKRKREEVEEAIEQHKEPHEEN